MRPRASDGRCCETKHLPRKGGRAGADGEKEGKTKPGQDERSGVTSGAPLPRCLLSPGCCGSSDSFKGQTVLSRDTQGGRLSRAMPEVTLGCEGASVKAESISRGVSALLALSMLKRVVMVMKDCCLVKGRHTADMGPNCQGDTICLL